MDVQSNQHKLIRQWIDSGESRVCTIIRACDKWKLSYGDAQALVQAALRDVVEVVGEIDRQEFLAQQMTRLEALAVRAQGDGNLAVALGCYRELHLLARLTGKG